VSDTLECYVVVEKENTKTFVVILLVWGWNQLYFVFVYGL
jgi:hypothetical protein